MEHCSLYTFLRLVWYLSESLIGMAFSLTTKCVESEESMLLCCHLKRVKLKDKDSSTMKLSELCHNQAVRFALDILQDSLQQRTSEWKSNFDYIRGLSHVTAHNVVNDSAEQYHYSIIQCYYYKPNSSRQFYFRWSKNTTMV